MNEKKKKPNVIHPTLPGAVGSRNSPHQEERNKESEARLIIDDMIEKIRESDKTESE